MHTLKLYLYHPNRHALRGGRVETVSLFYNYKSEPDKALSYIDNNSLYPHVNIYFLIKCFHTYISNTFFTLK